MFSQYNYFFLKASRAPKPSGARGLCPRWLHGCDAPEFNPTAFVVWEPIRLGRTDRQTDGRTDGVTQFPGVAI